MMEIVEDAANVVCSGLRWRIKSRRRRLMVERC